MSLSYKAFTDAIRRELWPFPGEAKSLVPAHNKFFLEAMIALQRWVPELRVNHTSVFAACSTYVQCGLTVVEAPVGDIKRVYTIAGDEWCDPVYVSSRAHMELLKWQRCILATRFTSPGNLGLPALQQGFRFAEATTDSPAGRARTGIWSINRKRFHLAPWLQSNESLVIEWDGEKKEWQHTDVLDQNYFDPEAAAVVKLYVQKSHERDFGCDRQKLRDLEMDYGQKLGDLMYAWKKRTENQENTDAEELNRGPTHAEFADDAPLAVSDETVAAFIADYDGGAATADVAALVKTWAPSYIVTGGDNWYGSVVTLADLDASVGAHYGDYIYPYLGTLADGAERTNAFFPGVGNHDRDPAGRLPIFLNYFNLKKPYYDFIQGHVHWFLVDGGYMNDKVTVDQADGNTSNSVQGDAFRLKMALSTARWKVVVVGFPPYASTHPEFAALRWPYKAWGADLVLTGDMHAYERLLSPEGYPLIVGGWSGRVLDAFAAVSPYSVVRYDADFGALKLTVSCDEFKVEAINRVGVLIDTLLLTKP